MKPNANKPHRLTGAKFEASGKEWSVIGLDPKRQGRLLVSRVGEESTPQSWEIEMVEKYILWSAAARKGWS